MYKQFGRMKGSRLTFLRVALRRCFGTAGTDHFGPIDLVLLGPPGVGKGTYGGLIAKWLNLAHISTGDLIRKEIEDGTSLGKVVEPIIQRGELIPDEQMVELLRSRVARTDAANGVLFDGFPRRVEQVPLLDQVRRPTAALLLSLREDVLIAKAINRRICKSCGRSYNLANIVEGNMRMPAILPKKEGICDSCGDELVHRPDDHKDIVWTRLLRSKELSGAVKKVYAERGNLYEFELTSGIDDMWPLLRSFVMDNILKKGDSAVSQS